LKPQRKWNNTDLVNISSQKAVGEEKAFNRKAFTNSFGMKFLYISSGMFVDDVRGDKVTVTKGFYI
jgi:hypothetical protein